MPQAKCFTTYPHSNYIFVNAIFPQINAASNIYSF